MKQLQYKRFSLRIVSMLLQWTLAATFIISGFLKALDPLGMAYKLEAYCAALDIPLYVGSLYLDVAVIVLSLTEFIIGIYLLLGMRLRIATTSAAARMTMMTAITAYVYATDAVSDCGCFGDAIVLTNAESLAKNIVLLSCSLLLLTIRRHSLRIISEHNQWLLSLYSMVYMLGVLLYSLHYLPLVDFTGYALGTDIPTAMQGEVKTSLIYSKNGEKRTFDASQLPDSTWQFESAQTLVESPPTIKEFAFVDSEGNDISDQLLTNEHLTFVVTLPNIEMADAGCSDAINDVYDFAVDYGLIFVAATASDSSHIGQ